MSRATELKSAPQILERGSIQSVIGILDTQVDVRVANSWPLAEWKQRGVDFRFYQCDETLMPGTNPELEFPEIVRRFRTIAALKRALKESDPESTFIIFFFHKYGVADHALFRAIDRLGFRYAFLLSDEGDLPRPDFSDFEAEFLKEIQGRSLTWTLKHAVTKALVKSKRTGLRLIRTLGQLRYHVNILRFAFGRGALRGPDFWVGKGQGSIDEYYPDAFPVGKRTKLLRTHLFLFDRVLRGDDKRDSGVDQNTAIFAGQNAVYYSHPGYRNIIQAENYYPALSKLFAYLKEEHGLKLVKTTHPWGKPEQIRPWINEQHCEFREGDSHDLIRDCGVVIGHCSTALYYAVIYNKPIVFVTTRELEGMADYGPYLNAMAAALGRAVVNLDDDDLGQLDWENLLKVDEEKYEKFVDYYIKTAGSDRLPVWDLVWNEIQR